MTIAIAVKVIDGIVLAADSAGTVMRLDDDKAVVDRAYTNAEKVFPLSSKVPLGVMFWSGGSIAATSVAYLAREAMERFEGRVPEHSHWAVAPATFTVESAAEKMRAYLIGHAEQHAKLIGALAASSGLGLLVAGYSANATSPEAWMVTWEDGRWTAPRHQIINSVGVLHVGQNECTGRIINGYSYALPDLLHASGVENVAALMPQIRTLMAADLVSHHMPLQEAVDLAEFLGGAAIGYERFQPWPRLVAGPLDIATITRHDGFEWVQCKHLVKRKCKHE